MTKLEERFHDTASGGAGETDDADAASTWGSGDRDDGVVVDRFGFGCSAHASGFPGSFLFIGYRLLFFGWGVLNSDSCI
jgi:hypothetical protein